MNVRLTWLFALLVCAGISAPAFAHHGAAAYETKLTTLKGTVTEFQFVNPHAQILFEVSDASGKNRKWIAESVSPAAMSRSGWTRNTLKPGDPVTVTGNCSKNGTPAMRLSKIVLADGRELDITRGEDYAGQ